MQKAKELLIKHLQAAGMEDKVAAINEVSSEPNETGKLMKVLLGAIDEALATGSYSIMQQAIPANEDDVQQFIDNSAARKTFEGTPCFAQERLAFDSAVRETLVRINNRVKPEKLKALNELVQDIKAADILLIKLLADAREAEVKIWAELNDDDEESEQKLFMAIAKVNAAYYKKGLHFECMVWEKTDAMIAPAVYKNLLA